MVCPSGQRLKKWLQAAVCLQLRGFAWRLCFVARRRRQRAQVHAPPTVVPPLVAAPPANKPSVIFTKDGGCTQIRSTADPVLLPDKSGGTEVRNAENPVVLRRQGSDAGAEDRCFTQILLRCCTGRTWRRGARPDTLTPRSAHSIASRRLCPGAEVLERGLFTQADIDLMNGRQHHTG